MRLLLDVASEARPALSFKVDLDSGFRRVSANKVAVTTEAVDRLVIDEIRTDVQSRFLKMPVKTDTGDPGSPADGDMYVNTADNKVRVYADGAWRDLATW